MPKSYSMTRKINLGRYGVQYETIDVGVDGCESKEEAIAEIRAWKNEIHEALIPAQKHRLNELDHKLNLTAGEADERAKLNKLMNELPF